MHPSFTYYGKVTADGIKIYRDKEMCETIIRNFAGMDIQITVEKKKRGRSLEQNKYYWCVIVPLICAGLQDAGYRIGKEGTHEFLKATFHRVELVNENTGEVLPSVGSTAKMSTVEMMEYFAKITEWAVEFLGVEIPAPNEQIKINL